MKIAVMDGHLQGKKANDYKYPPHVPQVMIKPNLGNIHGPCRVETWRAGPERGRAEAGRAHKPTKWNGPGRAGLSHPTGRAGPGFTFFR